jgi:hypothetical protein
VFGDEFSGRTQGQNALDNPLKGAHRNYNFGERLEVRIEPPDGRGMTFRPTVLNAETNRELRWLGHLLAPGLFDGEHSFTIQPLEDNRVRFVQREAFKGLLVPLFARSLDNNTRRGFEEMNRAVKERAEVLPAGY